jgi:hypothetical protein
MHYRFVKESSSNIKRNPSESLCFNSVAASCLRDYVWTERSLFYCVCYITGLCNNNMALNGRV